MQFEKQLKRHLKTMLAYRHRAFYAANEAAEIARLKREGKNPYLEKTTAMLEGNNRVMRTRERKALCFRALKSVEALYGLYTLYHNTVGTGYGSPYVLSGGSIPPAQENIFARFLVRKKSKNRKSETPIRLREVKYNQNFTQEINSFNSLAGSMIPK
ncbi:MAG: hypothetical protein ACTSRS_22745 [Candidatus Helarchaeota archaeon]